MKQSVNLAFALMCILFCVCLTIANILEVKIVAIGHFTMTAGLIVFPLSYIINDCVAEVWGYGKTRLMIWVGFLTNFIAVAFLQLAIWLPPSPEWPHQEAFATLFGLTPRIVAASFVAFLVGSFINAYVMSRMKIASKGRNFSLRAIVSTLLGEGADSVIFFPLAFGGLVSLDTLLLLIFSQMILKSVYEIIALPVTIRVVRWVKHLTATDVYDTDVSYNVFKIRKL